MALISLILLSYALPFIHGEFRHGAHTNHRRTLPESTTLCSANTAYVEVSATKNTTRNTFTIHSTHALFPQHSYYVNWTDLVSISDTENVCNVTATSSINITNRSVLLYESIGNCSVHTKVIWAQQNNAIAVLVANDEDTDIVYNATADQSRIPIRSISKTEAQNVQDFMTSGFVIRIKIGCLQNETYSSILCVTDNIAEVRIIMGEYQRQEDEEYNGHPLWKMEGLPSHVSSKFIFLHDAQDDRDSYWVIAEAISSAFDNRISLQCTIGNIRDPTLCPLWEARNTHVQADQPHITVMGSVCVAPPTNYSSSLCVSSQYEVPGLLGTYHLFWQTSKTKAYWLLNMWVRELSECDHFAAYLYFHTTMYGEESNNFTTIYDAITRKKYAHCHSTSAQKPENCQEWQRLDSRTLRMITDKTFNVTIGACADTPTCVKTEAPERFCLANSSVVNGNLMGEYVRINERGPHFNSSIYKRLTPQYAPSRSTNPWNYSIQPLYIWYLREFEAEFPSNYDTYQSEVWILSSDDLQEAFSDGYRYAHDTHDTINRWSGFYGQYGVDFAFCYGYAYDNPVNCKTWMSSSDISTHIPYLIDETMTSSDGHCADNLFPDSPSSWPQYVCLDLSNQSMALSGDVDTLGSLDMMANNHSISMSMSRLKPLTGRYALHVYKNDRFPTWKKEPNAYDELYNIWPYPSLSFVDNLYSRFNTLYWSVDSLKCDPYIDQSNSLNPLECKQWFYNYEGGTIYGAMYFFNFYECTEDDVFTVSPTVPTDPLPGSNGPATVPTGPPTKVPVTHIAPTKAALSSTAPTNPPTDAITKTPTKTLASSTVVTTSPTKSPIQAHIVPTNAIHTPHICISSHVYGTSLLEGTYSVRDDHDAMKYVKEDSSSEVYVWYHDSKWIISPSANKTDHVYAYCVGGESNGSPICTDCWNVFWHKSPLDCVSGCKWIRDCTLLLAQGTCDGTKLALVYPDRLCVSRNSYLLDEAEVDSTLFGEYRLNAQSSEYYVLSSFSDASGYIWRDTVTNYWFVGQTLNDPVFVCRHPFDSCYMMDNDEPLSTEINVHITELGEDEICKAVPLSTMLETQIAKSSEQKAASEGKVAGPVIGILLCFICIAVGVVLFLKCKKDKTGYQKSIEEKEMIAMAVDERDVSTVVEAETIAVTRESDEDVHDDDDAPLNEP